MRRTSKAVKEESELRILHVLLNAEEKMRWRELMEATDLSSRTLNLRLKSLRQKGYVSRTVDIESGEYPPPVYYQITDKAQKQVRRERESPRLLLTEFRNELMKKAKDKTVSDKELTGLIEKRLTPIIMFTLFFKQSKRTNLSILALLQDINQLASEIPKTRIQGIITTLKEAYPQHYKA